MQNLLDQDLKPLDILTRNSFLNAIKLVYVFGGSTNAVIHLLAIARTAGKNLKNPVQYYSESMIK